MEIWAEGPATLLSAVFILISSWALSESLQALHTGEYLIFSFGPFLKPSFLPFLVSFSFYLLFFFFYVFVCIL
jgi:Na+/H+ antiporter NhaC